MQASVYVVLLVCSTILTTSVRGSGLFAHDNLGIRYMNARVGTTIWENNLFCPDAYYRCLNGLELPNRPKSPARNYKYPAIFAQRKGPDYAAESERSQQPGLKSGNGLSFVFREAACSGCAQSCDEKEAKQCMIMSKCIQNELLCLSEKKGSVQGEDNEYLAALGAQRTEDETVLCNECKEACAGENVQNYLPKKCWPQTVAAASACEASNHIPGFTNPDRLPSILAARVCASISS
eukprot:Filipodium_phascolosomae@DN2910_c0_g1_i1.p1